MIDEPRRKKITSYYPCIKYKASADLESDGTDNFIVAESVNYDTRKYGILPNLTKFIECDLSFSCKNEEKAFYKIIKDCF